MWWEDGAREGDCLGQNGQARSASRRFPVDEVPRDLSRRGQVPPRRDAREGPEVAAEMRLVEVPMTCCEALSSSSLRIAVRRAPGASSKRWTMTFRIPARPSWSSTPALAGVRSV